MGHKCAGPLQLRVKPMLVQRPDQSRSSISIRRLVGFHGGTKPVIQAAVETLIHYFPHMCELRAARVAGMAMRSPATGGLDDMPDARICDPTCPLTGPHVRCCCAQSSRGSRVAPSRFWWRRGSRWLRLCRTTHTRWVSDDARHVGLQGHHM
jgi:hypothetical protein